MRKLFMLLTFMGLRNQEMNIEGRFRNKTRVGALVAICCAVFIAWCPAQTQGQVDDVLVENIKRHAQADIEFIEKFEDWDRFELKTGSMVFVSFGDLFAEGIINALEDSTLSMRNTLEFSKGRSGKTIRIRIDPKVAKNIEEWISKVKGMHEQSPVTKSAEFIQMKRPEKLGSILTQIAFQTDSDAVPKFTTPPLRFLGYCLGNFGAEEDKDQVLELTVQRFLVFTTPSPIAAASIKSKFALPGRVFDKHTSFSTDMFSVGSKGSITMMEDFRKQVYDKFPTSADGMKVMAIGSQAEIMVLNTLQRQKVRRFLDTVNANLFDVDSVRDILYEFDQKQDKGEKINKAKAASYARLLCKGPGIEMIQLASECAMGSELLLERIGQIAVVIKTIQEKLPPHLYQCFLENVASKRCFAGVDYTGAYVVQGFVFFPVLLEMQESLFSKDGGNGPVNIDEGYKLLIRFFNDYVPTPPFPVIPPQPIDPTYPQDVKNMQKQIQQLDDEIASAAQKLRTSDPLSSYYNKLVAVIHSGDRAKKALELEVLKRLEGHAKAKATGKFDKLPEYQEYQRELSSWIANRDTKIAEFNAEKEKLSASWARKKDAVLEELNRIEAGMRDLGVRVEDVRDRLRRAELINKEIEPSIESGNVHFMVQFEGF